MMMRNYLKVIALVVCVLILILLTMVYDKKRSEKQIAKIFYEENYHQVLSTVYGDKIEDHFKDLENHEIVINLDYLLLFKNSKMIAHLEKIECNLNESELIIVPKEPYRSKDYSYIIKCTTP